MKKKLTTYSEKDTVATLILATVLALSNARNGDKRASCCFLAKLHS